jgi:hypothetical protein
MAEQEIKVADYPALIREVKYYSGHLGSSDAVGSKHEELMKDGWKFLDGPTMQDGNWVLSYIKREEVTKG